MQSAKTKVKAVVQQYIKLFPTEYESFLISTRKKTDNLVNEFAELKQSDQMVRHLFDLPLTLHNLIQIKLTDEEYDWLYARNSYEKTQGGLLWFVRSFPQFKITKDF